MPLALDTSIITLAIYGHLLENDALGKPTYGLKLSIATKDLWGSDLVHQRAWRELVEAGIAIETPDFGRYSKYTYNGEPRSQP